MGLHKNSVTSTAQNLKLSQYVIDQDFWDQKDQRHKTLLLSTRSSQLIIMDAQSWQNLREGHYENFDATIFNSLTKGQFLVPAAENELSTIIEENKEEIENNTHFYTVIQPTASCPLGCGYCGQLHSPKGLSAENQQNLLLYLRKKLAQKKYKTMSIGWFGAEPLSGISVIDALSPRIQALAKEQALDYSATIVTNGLLLREDIALRLVNEYAIQQIEITLDGIADYHDQRRHLKTGGATFDKIYANLLHLTKIAPDHVDISVRCNTDARNKEGISPLLQKLAQDGLHKRVRVYFAQIHSWGNDAQKLAAKKEDFAEWEIDWFMEMAELGYEMNYLPTRQKILCIAVDPSSDLIDPFGNIFSCTEVSLVPTYEVNGENIYKLGHLADEKLSNPEKRQIFGNFYEEVELKKYPCFQCQMLPVCGGACPKSWKEGDVPCPSAKYNIRERMLLNLIKNHYIVQEAKL